MNDMPEKITAWVSSEGISFWWRSRKAPKNKMASYTRSDLCVTPQEAEALRAENMRLRREITRLKITRLKANLPVHWIDGGMGWPVGDTKGSK